MSNPTSNQKTPFLDWMRRTHRGGTSTHVTAREAGEIIKEVEALLAAAETTCDAEDAAKWRALRNCARITAMGSAGLEQEATNDYAHLTLNLWTSSDGTFDGDPGPAWAREWLDKFVNIARRAVKSSCESSGKIRRDPQ